VCCSLEPGAVALPTAFDRFHAYDMGLVIDCNRLFHPDLSLLPMPF